MDLYDQLEFKLQYHFKNRRLLMEALTHSSAANENSNLSSNDRLLTIGARLLPAMLSIMLYKKYPVEDSAFISKSIVKLTNEDSRIIECANALHIRELIISGKGVESSNDKVVGGAYKALFAAICFDSNFDTAFTVFNDMFSKYLDELSCEEIVDSKTKLQELVQQESKKKSIEYIELGRSGPDNATVFTVGVYIDNKLISKGTGTKKKKAEQDAAARAIDVLYGKGQGSILRTEKVANTVKSYKLSLSDIELDS